MKRRARGIGVGTISLIMIFAVLCLTVFSMLTLATSNAEKILAERTSSFVKGYYEADAKATQVMSQLLHTYGYGIFPESVEGVDITYGYEGGNSFISYSCEVNDVQELSVRLRPENGGLTVVEWKTGYARDWQFDDSINVWDPDSFDSLFTGD